MIARPTDCTPQTHRFGWDGFSLELPLDWNLSYYEFDRAYASVRIDDDSDVRLEMEWMRPPRQLDHHRVMKRYQKKAGKLTSLAKRTRELTDLPADWFATLYEMPESRTMVTAIWQPTGHRFFAFLRFHFPAGTQAGAAKLIHAVTASAQLYDEGSRPWAVLGIDIRLDHEFQLATTAFQAGNKHMAFSWGFRRLLLWQFSMADVLLKSQPSLTRWAVDFLNKQKSLRGAFFAADGADRLQAKRNRRYPLGHYEEIGRQCFRYRAGCRHLPEHNAIVLWVYNFRTPNDLAKIRSFEESVAHESNTTGQVTYV